MNGTTKISAVGAFLGCYRALSLFLKSQKFVTNKFTVSSAF